MRLDEILNESVTFGVARLENINGHKVYSDPFEKEVEEPCWVCDGTGKESQREYTDDDGKVHPSQEYTCEYCKGKKTTKTYKPTYNELNVANGNAMEIQRMLGLDPDYSGAINNIDLPVFRRKLIKLKNTNFSSHTREPETTQSSMRAYKDDNGQDRIGRGPKVIDMGRSHSQVERYIDSLLYLIDFAQKNNCDLVWA